MLSDVMHRGHLCLSGSQPPFGLCCTHVLMDEHHVLDWLALLLSEQLIPQGRSGSALFKGNFLNTEVIAVRIDFKHV